MLLLFREVRSLLMDNTTSFKIKKIWLLFKNSVRAHVLLLGVVTVYTLVSVYVAKRFDVASQTSITLYTHELGILSACFMICFFCGHALYVTFGIRPKRLLEYYFSDLRENYFSGQRSFTAALVLLFFPIFFQHLHLLKIFCRLYIHTHGINRLHNWMRSYMAA